MANRILKGLAVAAGTGLAMGMTSGRTGRIRIRAGHANPAPADIPFAASPLPAAEPDDEFLNIEPLLDRLERLEARVDSIGRQRPVDSASADYAAALASLERRAEENVRDVASLRAHVTDAERRMMESVANIQRSVEQTRAEIPAIVERHISARIEDLESRFTAEILQSQQRTFETFERAIDEKIASRIGSIEKALADQAGSVAALAARATETDNNLQRLVSAIEKLCERAQLMVPVAEPPYAQAATYGQYGARLPFESQLHDAMGREPVIPVLRTEEPIAEVQAPAFTGSEATPSKKSRFLFRNLIVAGFGLLASRLLR